MFGKLFMPFKRSKKAETTEPSTNRLEKGHPFLTQYHLGKTEPPNDEESVKARSGLVLMQGGLRLTEPPKEEEWEESREIHLMNNELSELPERPMCPILSELYLQGNYKLRKIPPSFFEHMHALQVLNLSKTGIRSLPDSLFRLVGLKKLFLNSCENFMMLSPKVGELKRLEVLNLEGTEIIDLPKEVENLANLKCLKVSFYGCMNHGKKNEQSNAMIHGGVISALSQLEELNIDVNPDDERWGICVEAIIYEIFRLMHLRTLKFYFPVVELLRHFKWYGTGMVCPSLSHFRFIVGHHSKRIISRLPQDAEFELKNWDRCLSYIYGEGVPEDIKKVLQHATAFYLDRHLTVKKLSEFGIENMELLKCCILGECNEIQVIIDGEDVHEENQNSEIVPESSSGKMIGLQSLEYLNIYYMKKLRSIWEGPVHGRCLSFLKSLTLHTCPKLTTIFPLCLIDNLYSLEELKVEDCPTVTSIISCENHSKHEASSITLDYFLPKLKKISLYYVPELVSISNGVCIAPKLEWLNFYNCPNLKSLSVEEVCSTYVKIIMGEKDWWESLEWTNGRLGNLDRIFVPITADDLINKTDTHHSSFLSPSHALNYEWSPPKQQGQDKERLVGAGRKRESMVAEMKQQIPPVRGNIKTVTGISQATSNTTSSMGSNVSGNSQFSAASSDEVYPHGQILPTPNLRMFTFAELKTATRNFRYDTVLGEGGFGKVFKGWLDEKAPAKSGSGTDIVVKKFNSQSLQGFQKWESDVNFLGRLSHPNLVKLLGFCWEEKELLLIYEFMQKGSLENHLFGRGSTVQPLPWELRLKIAIGAARGLAFLHMSEKQVIYRDFKASKILLDGSYNAKISDFDLVRMGLSASQSHVTTRVMGTYGYAAPEYVATGHLYVKSDVYGFGVVLAEMLTGLRALDQNRPSGKHNLVDWIKPYLAERRKLKTVMDSRLEGRYPSKAAIQTAQLALKCIAPEPKHRPSMKEVVETLERIEASNEKAKEPRIHSTRSMANRHGQQPMHHLSPLHPRQEGNRAHQHPP